ncbi:MAG: acyl carrier protein [Flavobacteriales bacterium]|jgi:acyl carrier protein|nr:acyl carrier protein [Flavobacteriales bacterium]MBK7941811.1 acyl carrier protein [Flavobacteriales bacterium]MBK9700354.1 acyl carrier protein [Flavobacteriales bacterium]
MSFNEVTVRERIRAALTPRLTEMGLTQADVGDGMSLTQSGVLDSFALMELIGRLEQDLHVELDFEAVEPDQFTTVKGLTAAFVKALSA